MSALRGLDFKRAQLEKLFFYLKNSLRIHARKPYFYEHLRKTVLIYLEIDKVTKDTSLPTRMSATPKSITPLNPRI